MNTKFKSTFKQTKSMLKVDFRRMFTMPLFYIMLGASFVIPILILVMTSMMDGSVAVDPQTGAETVIEGFKNVWQIIGSTSGSSMEMSIISMCNINMMFFLIAVLVCIFVADDFRSGYSKNLFTVRPTKTDYAISKIVVGFVGGASMLLAFFVGAMLGGAIAGLSFSLEGTSAINVVMCIISKIFLVGIFVSIYVLASIVAKQKLWLSLLLAFGIGMLFFTMIPLITPLDCSIINVILCLVGSVLFSVGFTYLSKLILNKQDIL